MSEAEVRYLMREEFAENAEDVIWRRSKLGLRLTPAEVEALETFMLGAASRPSPRASVKAAETLGRRE